jgi:Flp pilus assembly protein TadD
MNLDRCYQLLGLNPNASLEEVKSAYRQQARQLHPDLNPHAADAHQRFISLNQAYQILLEQTQTVAATVAFKSTSSSPSAHPTMRVTVTQDSRTPGHVKQTAEVTKPHTPPQPEDTKLKWETYAQLKSLLKQGQFAKAIAVIEGLAQRLPDDLHVCQWQGIVYSQFASQLIDRRQIVRARTYLKKALKVDPHNRDLWQRVNAEFSRIERILN